MLSRIRQKELIAKIPIEDRTPQDIVIAGKRLRALVTSFRYLQQRVE
jgi:hypothetical protein